MSRPLLKIEHLSVSFATPRGEVRALRDLSLTLAQGKVLAVVGESGCGKSVLCKSVLGLLPKTARREGTITLDGWDVTGCKERELRRLRGRLCSMVFQNPMSALTPTLPVGGQIAEAVRVHAPGLSRPEARRRALELMELVGISQPEARYGLYPHAFSGGTCQRAVLAIALASSPKLLLADEPTTALDVTIQAQILDLLRRVRRDLGAALLLVTHDFGVVARTADYVAVMYAGKLVEYGTAEEVFYDPRHPYTWGLLRALPARARPGEALYSIPGMPPSALELPEGDAFACRNEYALAIDYEEAPPVFQISETHFAASWLLDPRAPQIASPIGGAASG